jgi:protein tyrosine phosphatase (PTP) superfamily phosphohydrolase (DUF442 family)
MIHDYRIFIATCSILTFGCLQRADTARLVPEASAHGSTGAKEIPPVYGPRQTDFPSLPNLLQITDNIYTGGEPSGDEAFARLFRLGVKTVVSVDSASPDVERARVHGLQYVHIPIGYDTIETKAGLSLARLVRDADGPFYVHCHHGRHRGPVAAVVAGIAAGTLDSKEALGILERAGTSKNYAGLWRAVENYRPPAAGARLPELVEIAEAGSLASAMAGIDRAYENLKLCRDAKWTTPVTHPDLKSRQQALLLKEAFREAGRNLAEKFDQEFRAQLAEAEAFAWKVENSLNAADTKTATQNFQALAQSCARCHEQHRD